jgi:hypothetical protein
LQPLAWALAALGLTHIVAWASRLRGWRKHQAIRIFSVGMALVLSALTVFVGSQRLANWDQSADVYTAIGEELDRLGVSHEAIVMVNNPPGFSLATGHSAIVVPNGSLQISQAAADRFDATVFVLERNHPAQLNTLYSQPQDASGIMYIASVNGAHIFFFEN